MDVIKIIADNSLTVRCLPDVVVSRWSYREGDEERVKDNPNKHIETLVLDLEYFKNTPPPEYHKNRTPEWRLQQSLKAFPKGYRKSVVETKKVKNAGWWLVKETKNTSSSVSFSRAKDFFAPTLEEALSLYLKHKEK